MNRFDALGWLCFAITGTAWLVCYLGDTLGSWPVQESDEGRRIKSATESDLIALALSLDAKSAEIHSLRERIGWRIELLRRRARPPTVIEITKHTRSRDDVA